MRTTLNRVIFCALLMLAGCGGGIAGTYEDEAGVTRYAFAADGAVRIHVLGAYVDAEYRLDGDKVLVTSAQGTVVLTRREDRLVGPMGLELLRQPE